ncbi:type I-C CRISPR-associated protein Cas7/Csd2 [Caryophanon latum]|uniref:Type I-C CRISPR-associated protein Cas7/Csd2 n=1 Tax=Caryophanon latum TaxID=33977 RepID=A0A1C0YV18_9BACL|nr:type I-C CRISPR-associated protein Cas7/Csd2 [Caryophanon latum]OCS90993.1 type I-C CRISPR-associated protein Cas7/Csd2 [Caryophanon latum]
MEKVEYSVLFEVKKANPNGDPDGDNLPRTDSNGYGFVTQNALKRKMKDLFAAQGNVIYLSKDKEAEEFQYPEEKIQFLVEQSEKLSKETFASELDFEREVKKVLCEVYMDIRLFGSVITTNMKYKLGSKKGDLKNTNVYGAVTVTGATSIYPIETEEHATTKAIPTKREAAKGQNDTMGGSSKFVNHGLYRFDVSVNMLKGEKNGVTEQDIKDLEYALQNLFINDASAARPAGSMNVVNVFKWQHSTKLGDIGSGDIFAALKVTPKPDTMPLCVDDYVVELDPSALPETVTVSQLK